MDLIPNIVRIGQCVMTVRDLKASRYFYVDLLGMNILHESAAALYLRRRGATAVACAKLLHPLTQRCIHCGYAPVVPRAAAGALTGELRT